MTPTRNSEAAWREKHEEFERLTSLEFREYSLARGPQVGEAFEYTDQRTQKLWTYWLQACGYGERHIRVIK